MHCNSSGGEIATAQNRWRVVCGVGRRLQNVLQLFWSILSSRHGRYGVFIYVYIWCIYRYGEFILISGDKRYSNGHMALELWKQNWQRTVDRKRVYMASSDYGGTIVGGEINEELGDSRVRSTAPFVRWDCLKRKRAMQEGSEVLLFLPTRKGLIASQPQQWTYVALRWWIVFSLMDYRRIQILPCLLVWQRPQPFVDEPLVAVCEPLFYLDTSIYSCLALKDNFKIVRIWWHYNRKCGSG